MKNIKDFITTKWGNYHKRLEAHSTLEFPTEREWTDRFYWLRDGRPRSYELYRCLGRGAFSVAFEARVCKGNGFEQQRVVVKFPIVDPSKDEKDWKEWLKFTNESYDKEFSLITKKLVGCTHANPVIDLVQGQIPQVSGTDGFTMLTVQPFLADSLPLDQWLEKKFKVKIRREHGKLWKGWGGIKDKKRYLALAYSLCEAVKNVHLHRVTHADLHPGNIFVRKQGPIFATLIDFGEAFPATPGNYYRSRTPKPYLSPERLGPRFPLNDRVDVYSFGILLLYLATGLEPTLVHKTTGGHREFVDRCMCGNRKLIKAEPRLVDLISRCTARDPADRPNFVDICETLRVLMNRKTVKAGRVRAAHGHVFPRMPKKGAAGQLPYNPVLLRMMQRSAREYETAISGLKTEMVELNGTRDETLRVLILLLDSMVRKDSWTTATTLSVWQRSALGLEGSYTSATFNAIRRHAAVWRIFIISIEELGVDFAKRLAKKLRKTPKNVLRKLADNLDVAIEQFEARVKAGHKSRQKKHSHVRQLKHGKSGFAKWHRNRFERLLAHLCRMMKRWDIRDDRIAKPAANGRYDIEKSKGLYIGFHIVPTLDEVGEAREDNPASLLHFGQEKNPAHQWILVTTTIGNRASHGEKDGEFGRPQLLGLRVFKSAGSDKTGKPTIRIDELAKLINAEMTVNVTGTLFPLLSAVSKALPPGERLSIIRKRS